jgi:cobalt/nickel transport system permease protein
VVSWFASSSPDGLEWAVGKVYGTSELPEATGTIAAKLKGIQERIALLPGYAFRNHEGAGIRDAGQGQQNRVDMVKGAASLSGLLGSAVIVVLILLVGFIVSIFKRRGIRQRA